MKALVIQTPWLVGAHGSEAEWIEILLDKSYDLFWSLYHQAFGDHVTRHTISDHVTLEISGINESYLRLEFSVDEWREWYP